MPHDLFTTLSPELICMILCYLDRPQDLYSVIRASSHMYVGGFVGAKEIILQRIIKNHFGPMVLPDAIVAARFLPENLGPINARHDRQQRLGLLVRTIRETRATQVPKVTMSESRGLCRLCPLLDYFIKDCSAKFFATARREADFFGSSSNDKTKNPDKPTNPLPLSTLELARLQRGFVRYLSLQSLIHTPGPPYHSRNQDVSAEHIAACFDEFTPWEVEEIACVHQYIISRIRAVIEDVEDYFVYTVSSTEQPSTSKYLPIGDDKTADLDSYGAEAAFSDEDICMFMEGEKRNQNYLIAHLATFDFRFLRALLEADNRSRMRLVHEHYHCRFSNLEDALKRRPVPKSDIFKKESEGCQNSQKLEFEGDKYEERNLAWLWSNQYEPQDVYYQNCNADLREWGYVFWDKDRLDRLDILKRKRPIFYAHSYPPHYPKPVVRPSVQKRLRDLCLA